MIEPPHYLMWFITLVITLMMIAIAFPYITHFIDVITNPPHEPDEYEIYVYYRDINDCTKANDSYCLNRSGCVHAYSYCQHEQCGVDF